MSPEIPLFKIFWDENDVKSVDGVIRQGMSWAAGPAVAEFESKLANYVGMPYCLTFNSGTSALHAAMLAHGFGPGDEIIVPSFTFIATANAPLFVGAKPVFAEVEERSFGLDGSDVIRKITDRTRAIMPIHYGGMPCRIDELKRIADGHNLLLVEDAAESLGAEFGGKKVGSFGETSILSFCQNKVITTGEGGAVLTRNRDIHQNLERIRSHGRREGDRQYFATGLESDYIQLGYNFRMPTMNAALGISQLEKIQEIIRMRREKAAYLTQKLSGIKSIIVPPAPDGALGVYQMFPIRVVEGKIARDGLKEFLAEKGITSRVYFEPVHLSVFYVNNLEFQGVSLPVTERLTCEILDLPIYPGLSRDDMDYIAGQISHFFRVGFI